MIKNKQINNNEEMTTFNMIISISDKKELRTRAKNSFCKDMSKFIRWRCLGKENQKSL